MDGNSEARIAVRVRFFAALRERFGRAETALELAPGATVADVLGAVGVGDADAGTVLAAVNHEHASADRVVADGDEVALFPPVTGG